MCKAQKMCTADITALSWSIQWKDRHHWFLMVNSMERQASLLSHCQFNGKTGITALSWSIQWKDRNHCSPIVNSMERQTSLLSHCQFNGKTNITALPLSIQYGAKNIWIIRECILYSSNSTSYREL